MCEQADINRENIAFASSIPSPLNVERTTLAKLQRRIAIVVERKKNIFSEC